MSQTGGAARARGQPRVPGLTCHTSDLRGQRKVLGGGASPHRPPSSAHLSALFLTLAGCSAGAGRWAAPPRRFHRGAVPQPTPLPVSRRPKSQACAQAEDSSEAPRPACGCRQPALSARPPEAPAVEERGADGCRSGAKLRSPSSGRDWALTQGRCDCAPVPSLTSKPSADECTGNQ